MRILLDGPPDALLGEVAAWLQAQRHAVVRPGDPGPVDLALVDARSARGIGGREGGGLTVALVDDDRADRLFAALAAGAHDVLTLPLDPLVWRPRLAVLEVAAAREAEARRQAERAQALIRELRDGSQRFEMVSRATNDLVYDWNIPAGRVGWGEALHTGFGYPAGIGEVELDWWTARIHPDDVDRVVEGIERALSGGLQVWCDEYRFARADGTWAEVLDRGIVMFDASGAPQRMVGAMMDITAQKQLQAQLVMADRMASVGTLAAGVAHEINNPLTWLGAQLHLATAAVERLPVSALQHELRGALADATEGARRIRDIVKDLRLFSRAEDDAAGPIDVRRVVESALGLAAADIRHRARLVKDLRPVAAVVANESRLGQVLLNLLLNAVQAIPEGSSDAHSVTVSTFVDAEGRVVIAVRDSGVGIAPEARSRIFDLFFTTKPVGEGTGLGLAISHKLVVRMGGEILVDSEPGVGSCFSVRLPPAPLPAPPPGPTISLSDAPAIVSARGRVLVIDDEELIVSFIEGVLAEEHEVVGFTRPTAALAHLAEDDGFDLVLCDLMMPELTGEEVYGRLAASHPELLPRTVFMTGGAFTGRARAFLADRGLPVLEKPFEVRALRALVRKRVDAARR